VLKTVGRAAERGIVSIARFGLQVVFDAQEAYKMRENERVLFLQQAPRDLAVNYQRSNACPCNLALHNDDYSWLLADEVVSTGHETDAAVNTVKDVGMVLDTVGGATQEVD
jgi:hypothetical protein